MFTLLGYATMWTCSIVSILGLIADLSQGVLYVTRVGKSVSFEFGYCVRTGKFSIPVYLVIKDSY